MVIPGQHPDKGEEHFFSKCAMTAMLLKRSWEVTMNRAGKKTVFLAERGRRNKAYLLSVRPEARLGGRVSAQDPTTAFSAQRRFICLGG